MIEAAIGFVTCMHALSQMESSYDVKSWVIVKRHAVCMYILSPKALSTISVPYHGSIVLSEPIASL